MLFSTGLEEGDIGDRNRLYHSENDRYLSLANDYGQSAYIFDLELKNQALKINRNNYHKEQTKFPITFIRKGNKQFLICATDWNHINIFDLENKNCITKRDTNKHDEDLYLDYF